MADCDSRLRRKRQQTREAADAEYDAGIRRLINRARHTDGHDLLRIEYGSYGFARNLYGMRTIGRVVTIAVFALSIAIVITLLVTGRRHEAIPFHLPALVSISGVAAWRIVTPTWVRPSAEVYADRVLEVAQTVAFTPPGELSE